MNKSAAIVYLIWSVMLIGAGIYIVRQMQDTTNPSSLSSSMQKLKEAIDEDSQVP